MAHAAFSPTSPLGDALVILGAAGILIPLAARLRINPVVGFILAGLVVGPFGLGREVAAWPWLAYVTISNPAALAPFAQFGIVLLLFSAGLELSLDRLWAMRRAVFGLGAAELAGCAAALALALHATGVRVPAALGLGTALAMSSTALVLPIAGTGGAVGHAALAMLLFEDIALVPIIFVLGALAPASCTGGWQALLHTLWLGAAVIAGLLVIGRFVLPRLFTEAARTRRPDLFLAISLLVVILAALATNAAGLSPIVGALIAGLLIAETPYHAEVEAITAPFKDLALGIFLITVGMGIDPAALLRHAGTIAAAVAGVIAVKAAVTALLLRASGARAGTAAEAGILLASPSETTLIVIAAAAEARLIHHGTAEFWRMVTALGLAATPLLALTGRVLARRVDAATAEPLDEEQPEAIIVGFGRVGRLIADMLARHGRRYVGVDAGADLVAEARAAGYPVRFGNAGGGHVLDRLGIAGAAAVILTMDDPGTAQRLTRRLRRDHPALPIIARARDAAHAAALYKAGASHAVPETLEASLQLSEAVLTDLGVAMGPVIASIHEKRDEQRQAIMAAGELSAKPKLRSSRLRDIRRTVRPER